MSGNYHEGERWVQEAVGERDAAVMNCGVIADRIPGGARRFVTQQQYVALAGRDAGGALWACFLTGPQGFASTDDSLQTLRLALHDPAGVLEQLPPLSELAEGAHLGAVFCELTTRRRLRVNGRVGAFGGGELLLQVEQAYPNCPKYIQRREITGTAGAPAGAGTQRGSELNDDLRAWIAGADTLFIASAHPDGPADASHRGGPPGFVRVDGNRLRVPDYPGNSMFNTFGNLRLNPKAGLVFPDFAGNRQLQLSGEVTLELDAGDAEGVTGGTGRWWTFEARAWQVSPLNQPFDWTYIDASPFNP